jgi:hypothetical protein
MTTSSLLMSLALTVIILTFVAAAATMWMTIQDPMRMAQALDQRSIDLLARALADALTGLVTALRSLL